MLVILFILCVVVMFPLCTYGGYRIALKTGPDYKKRWEEALNLINTQTQLVEGVNNEDVQRAVAKINELRAEEAKLQKVKAELPAPQSGWKLKVEYPGNYATFWAVKKGSNSVKVGSVYGPSTYPGAFKTTMKQAREQVQLMNEAEVV